jgi:hypothetical protein
MRVWVKRTVQKLKIGFYSDDPNIAETIQALLLCQMANRLDSPPVVVPLENHRFMVALQLNSQIDLDESANVLQEAIAYLCAENGIDFKPLQKGE